MKWQPIVKLTQKVADISWRLLIVDDDDGTLWTTSGNQTEEGYLLVRDESGQWFIETDIEPLPLRWFMVLDDPEDTPIDW